MMTMKKARKNYRSVVKGNWDLLGAEPHTKGFRAWARKHCPRQPAATGKLAAILGKR